MSLLSKNKAIAAAAVRYFFRVTKSTGGLLALVKASDPPSALEAYARMRGHLSFARLASACGLAFADAQKAFVTQEVGSAQPIDGHSRIAFGYRSC